MKQLGAENEHFIRFKTALKKCHSVEEAADLNEQLMLIIDTQPKGEAPRPAKLENGLRRPTRDGTLLGAAVRCQLDVLVEKFGLSVEELVENAWVHKAQEHLPLDDLATPYDAAQDFIEAATEQYDAGGGGAPLASENLPNPDPDPDPDPDPNPN